MRTKFVCRKTKEDLRRIIALLTQDYHDALVREGLTSKDIMERYPIITEGLDAIMKVPRITKTPAPAVGSSAG